jgi:hypothetical protein
MLTAPIDDHSAYAPHQIPEEHLVPGEAATLPTVALEKEIAESLRAWPGQQDHQDDAGRFYEVGQIGYRRGVPLHNLLGAIRYWTEQAVVARVAGGPDQKAVTLEENQHIQDAATEFALFVKHYVVRGYQDAVR